MIRDFKLPDLGEGLTESEIVAWQVSVGDTVTLNQVIAEVETAKAVVELPSPYAGVVTAIVHEPGTVVEVGEVIISFDVAGPQEAPSAKDGPGPQEAPGPDTVESTGRRVPTLVGYGAEPDRHGRPQRRPRHVPAAARPERPAPAERPTASERPRSTPPVRKLARELGVDLVHLVGSGPDGLITRHDVMAEGRAAAAESADGADGSSLRPASSLPAPELRQERSPLRGVRKAMAAAMVGSAFSAPHVTEFLTVDVTAGMEFLQRLRATADFAQLKLSPLTLAARAVCLAVARQPSLNSHWDQAREEVVSYRYVNLGIAAATPRGLLVPMIPEAQSLGLRGLAQALGELAETARAGKTPPERLRGGTFTITNIGVFGIDAGTPILNPGEAGILALGAVRTVPWAHQGTIALRQVMTLSLSFDHRLVDGEQGSRFLADVGAMLADPAMGLAYA